MNIIVFFVALAAGLGAGVVTGLVGASAAVVVVPVLVTFLGYDIYEAIGISLATDVAASLTATRIYAKNKNINIKHGVQMALFAAAGAQVGSLASLYIPQVGLVVVVGFFNIVVGINFLRTGISLQVERFGWWVDHSFFSPLLSFFKKRRHLSSIFFGLIIGMICGVVGAGGGLMIMLILVFILDYPLHKGIGTSVLIMAITAFSGTLGHALYRSMSLSTVLIGCVGGIFGARSTAAFANLSSEEKLSKVVGIVFILLGLVMLLNKIVYR
ncbi:MAG: sulfite exporter TauE/SafE family protein [Candidatus Methanolliviera hydrocarbonicum]|uniref:Probable membrane transporter protein n=1 Tax=Candidatus Methanolliviera hydrocarbonicum TaxID=2491085 RepID=A0A520KWL6_9EURY|nr:MAG: sulfite exporter TauE/SafE family protein [Candidatus Methanolliviera hydrocarbonicum]